MHTKNISTGILRSLWFSNKKINLRRWVMRSVAVLTVATAASPAFSASDNCPSVNGIANMKTSAQVTATYAGSTDASGSTVFTYKFSGTGSIVPVNGVPGLISYCVFPDKGNLPNDIDVDSSATGANGALFVPKMAAKGSFSFTRDGGNPSNIPLDGLTRTMGTATWNGKCTTDPNTGVQVCQPTAAEKQTILLHINDAAECANLYGTSGDTCWVYPGNTPPNPPLCNGEPACKSAVIDLATGDFDANGYPIVPLGKLLHIKYTYVIVNQPGNTYNMIFNVPTQKTQDINAGGGKDYFGCEQIPDPDGAPGSFKTVSNYQSTGFTLTFFPSSGNNCAQSRFQLTAPGPSAIVLEPGQSVSFTVDMITRINKGGKQEFTSAGPHLLNSGFTVKWFQSNDNLMHSFTTGITPLYVNAQP